LQEENKKLSEVANVSLLGIYEKFLENIPPCVNINKIFLLGSQEQNESIYGRYNIIGHW